jgi:exonuclease VII small subunit
MYLYNQFLAQFSVTDSQSQIFILIFALTVLISQVLRIIVFIGCQIQYSSFKITAKDLKTKSEIASVKAGLIARAVKDYTRSCEKGIAHLDARAITKKHILRTRFIYWTYESLSRLVSGIEGQILFIGILLVLCIENQMFAGMMAVSVFILVRILAATFDYEYALSKLENEIVEYLEREIGQFYVLDVNTGILRLNKTLTAGAEAQVKAMSESVKALGDNLVGVLKLVVGDIRKNIDDTVNTINSYSDVLKQPLNEWKQAVELATAAQAQINKSAGSLNDASLNFAQIAKSAEASFSGYIEKLESEKTLIKSQIDNLQSISSFVEANSELTGENKKSLETALSYIEKNQAVLEESLSKYELALQQITGKLGDALGSILNFHIEKSYSDINSQLTDNIGDIIQSNSDLAAKLRDLFEEMSLQMKAQLKTVINIKEQMEETDGYN